MGVTGPSDGDHVIVCGLTTLGLGIAEQLDAAGVRTVVVDDRDAPALRRQLERLDITLIPESTERPESLLDAGLDRALGLVTCRGTDLENLRTCLVAADTAPATRIVANIDSPQLGDQLQDAYAEVRVLSAGGLAGPGFVAACLRSAVIHAFAPDGTSRDAEILAVVNVDVPRPATFGEVHGDLTPVLLRRAGERRAEICPPRDVPVAPGDRLVVLGRLPDLRRHGLTSDEVRDARMFATLMTASLGSATAPAPVGTATAGSATADAGTAVADAGTTVADAGRGTARRGGRHGRAGRLGARQPRGGRLRRLVATARAELDAPFRRALAVVAAVTAVSTVVLALTYRDHNPSAPADFDALDALYLTVGTMVTVGYGDFNFGTADTWLQVFGIGLMLVGALAVAVVYAFITNVIVSRRLERVLGIGQARTARDHVIICGLGAVGLATMEGLLRAGRQVVVVERNENNRYLPVARERGVPVVIGDATVGSTLVEAGLDRATTIAAMTADGHANLETVLSARQTHVLSTRQTHVLSTRRTRDPSARRTRVPSTRPTRVPPPRDRAPGPAGTALRVVTRVLDTTLADEIEHRFGIHTARSATALAVPYFLAAAIGHQVVGSFHAEQTSFLVARIAVGTDGAEPDRHRFGPLRDVHVLRVHRRGGGAPAELLVVGPTSAVVGLLHRGQPPPPQPRPPAPASPR